MASFTPQAAALALNLYSDSSPRIAAWPAGVASRQQLPVRRLRISPPKFSERRGCPIGSICASSKQDTGLHVERATGGEETLQLEDVVIAGGGIAGLATALALHRVGVKSIVLEQSDSLRAAGTSIGIWTNAWRALEALGVSESLRNKFERITEFGFYAADGKPLSKLNFQDGASGEVELRAVERKMLLEALIEPLPHDTVRYNARVVDIEKLDGGYTKVELQDGSRFRTKVLIGCDGIGSVVARWMGFKEPRYVGYFATRGVAVYPEGHSINAEARQILGRGVRAGLVPMDSNRVYWFIGCKKSSAGKITDPELIREEALSFVQGWPSVVTDAIVKSPPESLSRRAISDRWMWPVVSPPFFNGGVTLAGDAMHPLTPNLGQGGCCALEEGVILGRELSKVLGTKPGSKRGIVQVNEHLKETDASQEMKAIELALGSYTNERRHRMFPLAVRSYITGEILNTNLDFLCLVRDSLLPRMAMLERVVDHTFYDCGTL